MGRGVVVREALRAALERSVLEGGDKGGCGYRLDQLKQKECQMKGGFHFQPPFLARKQILGYERPVLAQELCKSR